jgi:hypothetical protein
MALSKAEQKIFEDLLVRHRQGQECSQSQEDPAPRIVLPSSPPLPPGIGTGWLEPEDDDANDIWLRWNPTDFLRVRITSSEPSNYVGHWVTSVGTYRECKAPTCPFCPQPGVRPIASPRRQRHLLAVELESGVQRIWEFSPKVTARLRLLISMPEPRPLRGLVLILGREGRRRNGEVFCRMDDDQGGGVVPEPINVPGELYLTWQRAAIRDDRFSKGGESEEPDGPVSF